MARLASWREEALLTPRSDRGKAMERKRNFTCCLDVVARRGEKVNLPEIAPRLMGSKLTRVCDDGETGSIDVRFYKKNTQIHEKLPKCRKMRKSGEAGFTSPKSCQK